MLLVSLITSGLMLAIFGPLLWRSTPSRERWPAGLGLVAALPMCWLMFHFVRLPLDGWLKSILGESVSLAWLRTAYAPLTEEPAKLWPLLLPFVRKAVTRDNTGRFALALGLGFALGEVFTVAGLITVRQPQVSALPWYAMGGFISERFMTAAIHGGMTAIALAAWRRGPGLSCGLMLAVTAHYLANFPITMLQRGWLGPYPAVAQTIVFLWVLLCFAASIAWLAWLQRSPAGMPVSFLGEAICPGCGQTYRRSLWSGLNFGPDRRYERCPNCSEWHWTKRRSDPDA
jgi:hypothetical protein